MKIKTNIGGILLLCALMSILPSCSDDSSDNIKPVPSAIFYVTSTPNSTEQPIVTTPAPTPTATAEIPSIKVLYAGVFTYISQSFTKPPKKVPTNAPA